MALSQNQLPALKAAILAETDVAFVAFREAGAVGAMAAFFNQPSAFVVYRSSVETSEIGKTVNYDAVAAMTTANLARIDTFEVLNPTSFDPGRSDIRSYFANTFSGALGGQGQATRDALEALWRRFAKRGERLFATGTGTSLAPGVLVFEGDIAESDVVQAINLV